jgi:hypothetical protein
MWFSVVRFLGRWPPLNIADFVGDFWSGSPPVVGDESKHVAHVVHKYNKYRCVWLTITYYYYYWRYKHSRMANTKVKLLLSVNAKCFSFFLSAIFERVGNNGIYLEASTATRFNNNFLGWRPRRVVQVNEHFRQRLLPHHPSGFWCETWCWRMSSFSYVVVHLEHLT